MQKLRVLLVTSHGCIAVHKVGWTLTSMGHEVHFSATNFSPTHSSNLYHTTNLWQCHDNSGAIDPRQLAAAIQMYSRHVDLICYANEPNWPFKIIRENTDKPCVFIIHDWTSIRNNPDPFEVEMEKYALENADGFVVISKGYLKKIREVSKKPSVLVYSKVPSVLFPPGRKEKDASGLTYEGGVKGRNDLPYNYPYRNWSSWAKEAIKSMKPEDKIVFYTANDGEDFGDYDHERIKLSPPILYNVLLDNLGRHTAGLVGSPYPLPDFKDAMPNKLFEYVAAGIPCLVINAPEAQEYVEQHGLGLGIRDPSEVGSALEKLTDHNVLRDRWAHSMESEMPKLLNLFEEIMCKKAPRVIKQMGS